MRYLFSKVVFTLGLAASSAFAGYTTVNPPTNEESHDRIFSYIYGGTFVQQGYNYTNGSITAVRVQDYLDTVQPNAPQALVGDPGTTDQYFLANYTSATATARYAVNNQDFGYITPNGVYHNVFNVTGWGYNVGETMTSSLNLADGQVIRFGRTSPDDGYKMSSLPSDNSDGMDHMVTYEIQNNGIASSASTGGTVRTWMIFFEDAPKGAQVADFDFNDMVIEIQATAVATPEPTSLALLPIGALALRRRRA